MICKHCGKEIARIPGTWLPVFYHLEALEEDESYANATICEDGDNDAEPASASE